MKGQAGFWDIEPRLAELSAEGDPLETLSATVDFEIFRTVLAKAVRRSDPAKGGRLSAHIALDRTVLRVDGREQPVTPGMAVTAEIKTGRRRVIDYLLAPLREYGHDGMRER